MRARQIEYQKQLNDEVMAKKAKENTKEKSKKDIKKEQERAKKITDGIN